MMENLKVKELFEICEALGITLSRAKRKQAILEIMKDKGVSAEEVDEAWVEIKARREEAEGEKFAKLKKLWGEKSANVKKLRGANVASVRRPRDRRAPC